MKVIVDTSIWSLALRRKKKQSASDLRILDTLKDFNFIPFKKWDNTRGIRFK